MKNILILFYFILTAFFSNAQLQIGSGINWKSSAGTYVVLDNLSLQHNASSASLDNVFKFTGNSDASISGATIPLFTNVEVALTGTSKIILQRSISVSQNLSFQSGLLNLNNNNIDLGTTGAVIGEAETTRIIGANGGYIQIINTLNAPNSANPGNLGAIFTSAQNLGSTTIRRGHRSQTNGVGAGSSMLRYFDIIPSNNTGLNATLRFQYLDAELNGLTESILTLWKSNNNTSWTNEGFTSRNTTANYVERTGINDFSRWTLSTPGNALPLVWNSFNTRCLNDRINISWKTEMENNTQSFIIQRSSDAINWNDISTLPAAGNSNSVLIYSYTDVLPLAGISFYRIKQHDLDGRLKYSPVLRISCGEKDVFKVYPNPTQGDLWISIISETNKTIAIGVYDNKGALLRQQKQDLQPGVNLFVVNLVSFARATYTLMVQWEDGKTKTVKVEKQ